jgi:hypothetical protein
VVESGQKLINPRPLVAALGALRRVQRRAARASLMALPAPEAFGPPTAERVAIDERRAALRAERETLDWRERRALRRTIKAHDTAPRRAWREATRARRREAKRARRAERLARKAAVAGTPVARPPAPARRVSNRGRRRYARVSALHERAGFIRADHQHKVSAAVSRSVDVLVLEDLALDALVRSPRQGRSVADAGLGSLRERFTYKAGHDGGVVLLAWRYFPSSKRCSACGQVLAELDRGAKAWVCPGCGAAHDRDLNAAANLAWYGRVAMALVQGGDATGEAWLRLAAHERDWFYPVGQARAECTVGAIRHPGSRSREETRKGAGMNDHIPLTFAYVFGSR